MSGTERVDQGFRAFRKERFEEALQCWGKVDPEALPRVGPWLAEAHFRLGLAQTERRMGIPEFRAAIEMAPEEGRFWYHLGLAHYHERDLEAARAALDRAARHGFQRREPLAYVHGLLELELDAGSEGPAEGRGLLAPIQALLREDWEALAATASLPAVAQPRGTPAISGMATLLRGVGQAGLGQWVQAVQTLGSLSQDLFPGPLEALRVVFLGRALDGVGRAAEARKLRAATLARTKNPTLAAEAAQTGQADLERWLEEGRWSQAATAAQDMLKAAPSPRARVAAAIALDHLGREAAAAGRWEEAGRHWSALLKLGGEPLPGVAACHHNLALAYEAQEKWDQAATAWEGTLAALPRRITKVQAKAGGLSPEALLSRRAWIERRALELRERTGNVDAVLRQRKALMKRNPEDLELRLDQAGLLMTQDKLRAADRELQAVLRQAPDHLGALEASARLRVLDGYPKESEKLLRRVLAREPGRISARLALAHILAGQTFHLPNGNHREAVRLLEEAIELAPREFGFRLDLAWRLLDGHLSDQAKAQIQAALELEKRAWTVVFAFWARRRDLAEARALVERGEALGQLDAGFYVAAGFACLHAFDDLERPWRDLFKGRKLPRKGTGGKVPGATKARPWRTYAQVLLDQGVALDPSEAVLKDLVAQLLVPHPSIALPLAERVAALCPSDPAALMDLAVAQSGAGQLEAARKTLTQVERACRHHPNRSEADSVRSVLRMVPLIGGVEQLHSIFSEIMGGLDDLEPDLDAEGIPF